MPGDERRQPVVELDRGVLLEMIAPVAGAHQVRSLELVRRGLSSTNYRVQLASGRALHLRLVPGSREACAKEVAVLGYVSGRVPAPKVRHDGTDHPAHAYYIAEWMPGTPLDDVLGERAVGDARGLGAAVARALLSIHHQSFDIEGELAVDGQVHPWPSHSDDPAERAPSSNDEDQGAPDAAGSPYAHMLHGMIYCTKARSRLGSTRADRLWHAILTADGCRDWSRTYRCLTHFDFNPKNLLVERGSDGWHVTAVLDWEFACVAGPLPDLGNMLRHRRHYPKAFVDSFVQTYQSQAPWLEEAWQQHATFADLSAHVECLASAQQRPASHRLALALIDDFLARSDTGEQDS